MKSFTNASDGQEETLPSVTIVYLACCIGPFLMEGFESVFTSGLACFPLQHHPFGLTQFDAPLLGAYTFRMIFLEDWPLGHCVKRSFSFKRGG